MRRPATALIAVIGFLLFSCSTLFASDFDAIQFVTGSISKINTSIDNGFQSISSVYESIFSAQGDLSGLADSASCTAAGALGTVIDVQLDAYDSWTEANREAFPKTAAIWDYFSSPFGADQLDHYTDEFGAAGIPVFLVGGVTNRFITGLTGIQPGSPEAKEAGMAIGAWTGGIVNLPMKVLLARDLNNPYSELSFEDRFFSVTAGEVVTYALFVGSPIIVDKTASTLGPIAARVSPYIGDFVKGSATAGAVLTYGLVSIMEGSSDHNKK